MRKAKITTQCYSSQRNEDPYWHPFKKDEIVTITSERNKENFDRYLFCTNGTDSSYLTDYDINMIDENTEEDANENDSSFSGWNYRVVKKQWNEEEASYDICEVYYDKEGNPTSWILGKNVLSQDNVVDLKNALEEIQIAMQKPILQIVGNDERLVEIDE